MCNVMYIGPYITYATRILAYEKRMPRLISETRYKIWKNKQNATKNKEKLPLIRDQQKNNLDVVIQFCLFC